VTDETTSSRTRESSDSEVSRLQLREPDSNEPAAPTAAPVTLVIPGRNCASTLRRCLESVIPLALRGELRQIIFVDDGSTDDSRAIAERLLSESLDASRFRILAGQGDGPGAARNLGWRAASDADLIWFIDSDCVAEPDALEQLLPHLDDPAVAGVGGSYGNLYPDSLLATLIHEEIVARHRRMPDEVNFLGGFNVIYRRTALALASGFDECDVNGPRAPGAEDCDLSFRLHQMGHSLRIENGSLVGHHHPRSLGRYLRSQRIHGHWRVRLYRRHLGQIGGDSYSGLADHLQPVSGLLAVCGLPFVPFVPVTAGIGVLACCIVNLACALAILRRLQLRSESARHLATGFCAMSCVRSVWRGIGIISGLLSCVIRPPQPLAMPAPTAEVKDDTACVMSGADGQWQEQTT